MPDQLANEFTLEMRRIHNIWKTDCDFNANRFLQIVNDQGGLNAAKSLLASKHHPDGLTRLWEEKRLEISMEATVLNAPWCALFSTIELEVARKRLDDLGYKEN
jgi:hypothetical protein